MYPKYQVCAAYRCSLCSFINHDYFPIDFSNIYLTIWLFQNVHYLCSLRFSSSSSSSFPTSWVERCQLVRWDVTLPWDYYHGPKATGEMIKPGLSNDCDFLTKTLIASLSKPHMVWLILDKTNLWKQIKARNIHRSRTTEFWPKMSKVSPIRYEIAARVAACLPS